MDLIRFGMPLPQSVVRQCTPVGYMEGVEQRYVLGSVASLYLTGVRRVFSNNSGVLQSGDDDGEKGER